MSLQSYGIQGARVRLNLSEAALYEEALRRGEGRLAAQGPIVCLTGHHTGRSPNDKFIAREPESAGHIAWGPVNRPMEAEHFAALHADFMRSLDGAELFVQDCWAGADRDYRLPIRIITEYAWHSLFARNMFIQDAAAASEHAPPCVDPTRSRCRARRS